LRWIDPPATDVAGVLHAADDSHAQLPAEHAIYNVGGPRARCRRTVDR
jgi:hypothetical protein